MKPTYLFVSPTGGIQCVADDRAEAIARTLGSTSKRRASHVLPEHPGKQIAFVILRKLFGETGRIADWCRRWRGPWEVRFAKTPHRVEFRHPSRRVCIHWEVQQLNKGFATSN